MPPKKGKRAVKEAKPGLLLPIPRVHPPSELLVLKRGTFLPSNPDKGQSGSGTVTLIHRRSEATSVC